MNHGFTIGAAIIISPLKYKKRLVVGKLEKNVAHPLQEAIAFQRYKVLLSRAPLAYSPPFQL